MTFARKYWTEILAFGGIFTMFMVLAAPDMTWINTDADGPHYVYSAKYLYPSHKTSAPLFLLLGHLFLKIPFGTEFWRMALISVFASTAASFFIYLSVKHLTKRKCYGAISAGIFATSALVISQSTIVETYAWITMCGVGAYYFALKERWKLCALMLGLGFAVHFMVSAAAIVLLVKYRELRPNFHGWRLRNVVPLLIICSFFAFYAYIPLTHRPPYMWFSDSGGLSGNWISDNLSTGMMLLGGLSIWDFPKRIFDTLGVLGVSFGLALIPIAIALKRSVLREPLIWMAIIPIGIYATNLAPQTYVYMMPSIAWGAMLAGIGMWHWRRKLYHFKYVVLAGVVVMLGYNIWYFDIGRTLDSDLAARQYYDNELAKVPDGEILLAQQGWEWAMVYLYNREEGRNIIPACVGSLPSPLYQEQLKEQGVFLIDNEEDRISVRPTNIALSIIELNENVWTTVPTSPEVYGTEIIKARGNEDKLLYSPISIADGSVDGEWRFKPSNPYDIITGAIEVDEWVFIVFSNYTVLTFTMMGTVGAVPMWILYMALIKRQKWSLRGTGLVADEQE